MKQIVFSTHCHNDLGLATANTLAGVANGARQVEVTINGIGERAGNTSLEEIIMTLYVHPDSYPVHYLIDLTQIYNTSQLVTKRTGMMIQPNKAIVGANAFAHESGIHQDGVLKHKETYEIIQPEVIGIPSNSLVLGKHSGRNAFKSRLETLVNSSSVYDSAILSNAGIMERLFTAFKKLADTKKRGVNDQDLYALLDEELNLITSGPESFTFKSVQVVSGSNVFATATVTLMDSTIPDQERIDAAIGHGPVNAIFSAISRIVGFRNVLASYDVKAITEGSDALGRVTVRITEDDGLEESPTGPNVNVTIGDGFGAHKAFETQQIFQGTGTDEDILIASAKAYLQAVNRYLNFKKRFQKTEPLAVDDVVKRQVPV